MRLGKRVVDKIKVAAKNSFGDVNIYLFGSRVDDSKRGGDIDIAIDTNANLSRVEFRKNRAKFISNLIREEIYLKIDIVDYNTKDKLLHDNIRNNSIKLNY